MEQFVKLSDVRKMLDYAYDGMEMERLFSKLKIYNAEYKPYMPIRIRDYGYVDEPHEYDCGEDQNHHWLQISEEDGSLSFTHMQSGAGSMTEEAAKEWGECCFVPTIVGENENGKTEKYITPEMALVILEDGVKHENRSD